MCVCDLRDALPVADKVAVLGRIGGIENPWTEGEASFVMSDPSLISLTEEDHECGDNCPYCAKKKQQQMDSMAFVQIVGPEGRLFVGRHDKSASLDRFGTLAERNRIGMGHQHSSPASHRAGKCAGQVADFAAKRTATLGLVELQRSGGHPGLAELFGDELHDGPFLSATPGNGHQLHHKFFGIGRVLFFHEGSVGKR